MKRKSIYSMYDCKNREELYRKVKNNDEKVKSLVEFINHLKRDRTNEMLQINSNIKLHNYLDSNYRKEGEYVLLLDTQHNLIKDLKLKGNIRREIIKEALNANAKNVILVNQDKDLNFTKSGIQKVNKLKEALHNFEINLVENLSVKKDSKDYHSFVELGLFEENIKYNLGSSEIQETYILPASDSKDFQAKEYTDRYIRDFKNVNRTTDFLKFFAEKQLKGLSMVENAEKVKQSLKVELSEREKEIFSIMYIDKANRIVKKENLFEGTIDRSTVYIRELAKKVINEKNDFDGIVIVHNHPSGSLKPSEEDILLTGKVKKIFEELGTELKDHLIVSRTGVTSFCEIGILENKYNNDIDSKLGVNGHSKHRIDFRHKDNTELER